MKRCPSPQELQDLLDEELSDARQEAVTEHVGSCTACQAVLECLTETAEDVPSVCRRPSGEPEVAFLTRLKETPPSSAAGAGAPVAPPAGAASDEPPAVAGYEILGELGRGGMGVVYKARHLALGRVVALKMILADAHAGPKDRARFRQEAEAIARLHHPHIVQVFDIGDAGGRPYFALEYVEHGSLAQHLRGRPQPEDSAALLIETLARAVAYAHQCGIVHRDLKPANILLSVKGGGSTDGSGLPAFVLDQSYVPKITDFGLAKRLDEEGTRSRSGEVLGTPSYMAPEQAEGPAGEVGPAADVYALGAILYELLTGRPPFRGATSLDTLLQVMHQEPVPPGRLRPKLPRDVETICLKCLEKDPARRYASATALADDLRRFRRGDPIEARPVGALERAWKWARRRPASAALVLGLVLVTLLGFSGVTWQWRVAVSERNEQEYQRQQARTALYYSNIAQSQLQWRVNELPAALRSLEDCVRPGDRYDRRGWEWYYLRSLYQPELFSFRHARPGLEGAVAFDPAGRAIASVVSLPPDEDGDRGELRLWDAVTGQLILARTLRSPFHRLAYSPDGKRLVLGSTDGKIQGLDPADGQERWETSLPGCRVTALAFSPDGKTVATAAVVTADGGKRGEIRLWDAEHGSHKLLLGTQEGGGFYGVAFHPTLPLLAAGGEENVVRLWHVDSGREEHSLEGHKSAVNGVAFSPDGKLLVSAGNNGDLKIWGLAPGKGASADGLLRGKIIPQSLTGRTGAILALSFSPDGRYFAYGGTDRTVRVWDVDSGTGSITFRGHTGLVEGVRVSPDGQRLVSCSPARGEVKVWDLTRHPEFSTLVRTTGDRDHPARDVEALAFHEDGRHLVSVTVVGELQVWDALSGVLRARHSLPVSAEPLEEGGVLAAFAPGGGRLAARCRDDRHLVRVWDVGSGTELLTCRGHRLPVSCVRFSPDGRRLATGACEARSDGTSFEIKVWDAAGGQLLCQSAGRGRVFTLAFSPDGRWLAAGNDDRLLVLDAATGHQAFAPLGPHGGAVTSVVFRPGGGQVVTAGLRHPEIHVWDSGSWANARRVNRQPVRALAAPPLLCDLAFSPDGKRLAAASRDLFKMWDAETGVEVLTLRGAPQRYRDPPFNARLAFHPGGTRLAGSNWNESISVWDAPTPADEESRLWQAAARRRGADERAPFWHLQEAEYCAEHNLTYGARFHLQRLRGVELPPLLRARAERVLGMMNQKAK